MSTPVYLLREDGEIDFEAPRLAVRHAAGAGVCFFRLGPDGLSREVLLDLCRRLVEGDATPFCEFAGQKWTAREFYELVLRDG